jgi:hypothetical protein
VTEAEEFDAFAEKMRDEFDLLVLSPPSLERIVYEWFNARTATPAR